MENNISNLSFKANLTTLTRIKNKSAFAEINQLFKKNTEKMQMMFYILQIRS